METGDFNMEEYHNKWFELLDKIDSKITLSNVEWS